MKDTIINVNTVDMIGYTCLVMDKLFMKSLRFYQNSGGQQAMPPLVHLATFHL